jgi:hypothetical protein
VVGFVDDDVEAVGEGALAEGEVDRGHWPIVLAKRPGAGP